jgi:hypothetical protein
MIKEIFPQKPEILDIIASGGSIVEFLGVPNEKCSLLNSEIIIKERLGGGNQGDVYGVEVKGFGTKLYALKKIHFELEVVKRTHEKALLYFEELGYSWADVRKFQPQKLIDEFENTNAHDYVLFVEPPTQCLTTKELEYKDVSNENKKMTIPTGSYVCDRELFSEYAISAYAGLIYSSGECAHFFSVYSAFTCADNFPDRLDEYDTITYTMDTFMDKIDGELNTYKSCISTKKFLDIVGHSMDIIDSICVQVIFAIAAYQEKYQISHNDLHHKNVFIELVTPETTFNNQNIMDADWYHYSFKGTNFYVPSTPMIVKIGDFGYSIKYSKPIIGGKDTLENGLDLRDGTGSWFPNTYIPSYDILYFMGAYILMLDIYVDHKKLNESITGECLKFMTLGKLQPSDILSRNEIIVGELFKTKNMRPILKNLKNVKNASDVIKGPIHETYGNKPDGKIVTLGKI